MIRTETITLAASATHPENAVAELLRDQIQSGRYKAGDWLPTERALADNLGVDRRTVRLAINRLVGGGLVLRRPHCRPIVAPAGLEAAGKRAAHLPEPEPTPSAASSFIALSMWSGSGRMERTLTSQQRAFWGMNQALAEAGYHGVFVDLGKVGGEEENAAREAAQLRYIRDRGFGGVIFYPYAYRSNGALIEEIRQSIPVIAIDRRCEAADTDFVGIANHRAMHEIVTHLIGQGHRRIAYVTKNEPVIAVHDRLQGYLDAMAEAGLPDIVLPLQTHNREEVGVVVDTVFRLPPGQRPTAAAVFNDYSAVDLTQHLHTLGLSVPGDVAVAGFDDIVPVLPGGVGLTTAAQPYEDIGRKAVECLLRRLREPSAPAQSVYLPAPLIIRESTQSFMPEKEIPEKDKQEKQASIAK